MKNDFGDKILQIIRDKINLQIQVPGVAHGI